MASSPTRRGECARPIFRFTHHGEEEKHCKMGTKTKNIRFKTPKSKSNNFQWWKTKKLTSNGGSRCRRHGGEERAT